MSVRQLARSAVVVAVVSALTALAACVLVWAGSDATRAVLAGRATVDDTVGAFAAAAGGGCLAWLCASVAAALASAAPGRLGAVGRSLAQRITPVLVRRAVAAALGASLAGSSMNAALAAPIHPVAPIHAVAPIVAAPVRVTSMPYRVVQPPLLDRPSTPPRSTVVIVRPGDCLWSIAAAQLGGNASSAAINAEWRRWYAANRAVIGFDPNHIVPGQRLVAP